MHDPRLDNRPEGGPPPDLAGSRAPGLESFLCRAGQRSAGCVLELLVNAYSVLQHEREATDGQGLARLLGERQAVAWRFGAGLFHLPDHGTAYIISDPEGDLSFVTKVLRKTAFVERTAAGEDLRLCVLGDMVDRGPEQVALVELLLDLKQDPLIGPRLVLLIGTHEWDALQNKRENGFFHGVVEHAPYQDVDLTLPLLQRVVAKYLQDMERLAPQRVEDDRALWEEGLARGGDWQNAYFARIVLYHCYRSIFHQLPRCILAQNGAFMTHGGIAAHGVFAADAGPAGRLECLEALAGEDAATTDDLVWSVYLPEQSGCGDNPRGKDVGVAFGPDALAAFLGKIGAACLVRGHQPRSPEGVETLAFGAWRHGRSFTITAHAPLCLSMDLAAPLRGPEDLMPIRL